MFHMPCFYCLIYVMPQTYFPYYTTCYKHYATLRHKALQYLLTELKV